MRPLKLAAALGLAALVAACAGPALDQHAEAEPELDFRDYFQGPMTASGIFFDWGGRAAVSFVADVEASWDGDTGTLEEFFTYSDGRTETRTWTIRFTGENTFTATAPDVVGEATGAQRGNAATMSYRLRLPRGDGEIVVSMEDWFYLLEDGTLINRARMSKFGLPVGQVFVTFRKEDP